MDYTTSLWSLLHCWSVLRWIFSFMSTPYQPWFLSFCQALLWRPHLQLLSNHHAGMGRLLLGHPEATSSPGWTSPTPSVSLHRRKAPAFDHSRGSLLNSLQWIDILSPLEALKLKAVNRCALMSAKGENLSLQHPGYAAVNTTQGTLLAHTKHLPFFSHC